MASVVEDAAAVVSRVFDEAERRDRVQAEARAPEVDVTIVVDAGTKPSHLALAA